MLFNTLFSLSLLASTLAYADAGLRHSHHARLTRRFGRERALGDVLGFGDRPDGITMAGRPTSIDPADLPEPTESESDSEESSTASRTSTITDSDSETTTTSRRTTTSSPSETETTSSEPEETSTTSRECRGILCPITTILSPVLPGPTTTPTPTRTSTSAEETETDTETDTDTSTISATRTSSSDPSDPTEDPTSTDSEPEPTSTSSECEGLLCPITSILIPDPDPTITSSTEDPDPTDTDTETTTDEPTGTRTSDTEEPTPTTTECSGLLCPVTSILSPVLPDPTTSTSRNSEPTDTDTETSRPTGTASRTDTESSSSTGILDPITSILSPIVGPSTTRSSSDSEETSKTSTSSGILGPITSILTSIIPDPTSSTTESGGSTTDSGSTTSPTVSVSSTTLLPNVTTSDVGPTTTSSTVSFPTTVSSDSDTSTSTTVESVTATSTLVVVPSQFSFVTESTLIMAPTDTTSAVLTITDPDAATSTVSLASDLAPSASPSVAPLPANLPSRIYSPSSVMTVPQGHTAVSILFNNQLGWEFVAQNLDTQGQLFLYFPNVVARALGIDPSQVPTFALQVVQPTGYTSTAQANLLKTSYLIFVPTDQVDNLSAQVRTLNSAFYMSATGIEKQIADSVDPASILTATPSNIGTDGGNDSGGGTGGSSGSSKSDETRRNAIIGVTTVLGGIALIIVVWLAVRAYKRNQETKHRRLSQSSDHFAAAGMRQGGEAFDQDSIGGQRRRSFYFAEDSLRGAFRDRPDEDDGYEHRISPNGMRERRPVMPSAIGQPILRESTMNW